MRALFLIGLLLGAAVQAAPGAHGPDGEHLDSPATTSATSLMRLPDGSVNVPMLAQRRLSIRTVLAIESEAATTVELPGWVVMDPNAGGRIQTMVGGKLEPGPKGLPVPGQRVKQGDTLGFIVYHAEPIAIANQQAQLAELRSARELARKRVGRLEGLEGSVPRKEIEAARAELESLTAREKSIGASLHAREALVAPISGVIARADAVTGQVVESRDVLFEVVDPARVLVEAATTDPGLAHQLGAAHLRGVPSAQLSFIGAARSLRDGVLPLTFRAQAKPDSEAGYALPLAVGQPVTVVAALGQKIKGFVLPAQAITRNPSNEAIVWIKGGAERYIPQPVQYRPLDAQTIVVTEGLGTDNRVVVQGAPLIAQIR